MASIQVDLNEEILRRFQQDLLERIGRTHASGVILDLSGVEIMDADEFESLRRASEMARIMGARSIMVGLQAGIVAALVDLDVNIEGVEATLDLESAFGLMEAGDIADVGQSETEPSDATDEQSHTRADGRPV